VSPKPILGNGQGFIAIPKILKETLILLEAPVFKIPRDEPSFQAVERIIIKELESLSKDQQRAFALHNAYGSSHIPSLSIARTNVLPLNSRALKAASPPRHLTSIARADTTRRIPGMPTSNA
jgi:hypothetical protein